MKSITKFKAFIIIAYLVNAFACNVLFAQSVDTIQAKLVATNFYSSRLSQSSQLSKKSLSFQNLELFLAHKENGNLSNQNNLKKSNQTLPLYYIFNVRDKINSEDKYGFVIVSADQRVPAILGYSFSGEFSENDQPPAFKEWMNHYKEQIIYVIQNALTPNLKISDGWKKYSNTIELKSNEQITEVAPLLTTTWGQGCFYNSLCPANFIYPYNCNHAVAGCVAIAMAQIMKYWNYPTANNPIPGYANSNYGWIPNVGRTTYDWSHMPNSLSSLSTSEEINAVSEIIYHCGVAVQMNYGPYTSGAGISLYEFRNYFNYPSNMQLIGKNEYSASDWENILRNELNNNRPIYYEGGNGSGSGHAFVCDGYQNTDYFHFNLGNGENNNGYFYLDDLTPPTIPYAYGQSAIIGISPKTIDNDENVYNTVIIGTQTWMAENLKTTKYNDGTIIPVITDNTTWSNLVSDAYCWYNNDASTYKNRYGALYNWYAVNTGKLCPVDWHVSTYDDYSTLVNYLGGNSIAGGKMKETGTDYWQSPNSGATNESGFTGLPGGWRNIDGVFNSNGIQTYPVGSYGYFLTSTTVPNTTTSCYVTSLGYNYNSLSYAGDPMQVGMSVRCVKDPTLIVTPPYITVASLSGATEKCDVTSNTNWTVTTDADWLILSSASGIGNGTLKIMTTSANLLTNDRSAGVTFSASGVSSVMVIVTQSSATPTLSVSSTSLLVDSGSGNIGSIAITSSTSWSVTDDATWITVTPSSGLGNGPVTVTTISANSSAIPRSANLTFSAPGVSSVTVTVTQNGTGSTLSVTPQNVTLASTSGATGNFNVASNTTWGVTTDADWLILSSGSGTGNGTVTFTTTSANTSGIRLAAVTFSASGFYSVTVTVQQYGSGPTLSVTPQSVTLASISGATWNLNLVSNTNWTITKDATWLNVEYAGGSGNASLTVTTTSANTSTIERSANVTFSASGVSPVVVTVTQNGTGSTLSVSPGNQDVGSDAGSITFNVSSNTSWTVSDDAAWLTVSPTSGSGNGTLTATFTANTLIPSRVGTITILGTGVSSKSVTVTQSGINTLSLTPSNQDVGSDAGSITFNVSSNTSWTVSDDAAWLTVSPTSGSDNGTLTATFTANTLTPSRVGTITISGTEVSSQIVTITQSEPTLVETLEDIKASIYPNPTNNYIYIIFDGTMVTDVSISVVDELGKSYHYNEYKSGNFEKERIIDITSFKSGLYFLLLRSKNIIKTYKIIKK